MLLPVIQNTVRQSWRSGALQLACVVVTLLLWVAAFAAYRNQAALNAQRSHYSELVRSQWLQQPDRHPHRASHYGYLAFRPKAPLSFVDSGVDSFAGTAVFLEPHRQNTVNFSEAGQSAAMIRLGELTPALVLQLLLPLVIFFLGFATISAERENGTFAMMLAQGVTPRTLMVGKALGLLAMAALLTLPGLCVLFFLPDLTQPQLASRLAVLAASYFAFVAICALVSVWISAWQRTSRASLTALILLWVFAGVVSPRALQAWGAALAQAPSKAEFDAALESAVEQVGDSHNPNDPHFAALRAKTLAEHKVTNIKDLPFNYSALVMKEGEEISSSIFRRQYDEILDTFRRQSGPTEWGAPFNPFLAIRQISMALSGSDLNHYVEFQRQAEAFRYERVQQLNDLHMKEITLENDRNQRVAKDRWQSFPAFVYHPPALGAVLRERWLALVSLLVWMLVLSVAVSFRPAVL